MAENWSALTPVMKYSARSYVGSSPSNIKLAPGEYAYVSEYIIEDVLRTDTDGLQVLNKTEEYGSDYSKIPCEAKLELSEDEYENYVYVTFTNDTVPFFIISPLQLWFMTKMENWYSLTVITSSIGIHPGSTITIKAGIDSDLVRHYTKNEITPTTVEALVYIED